MIGRRGFGKTLVALVVLAAGGATGWYGADARSAPLREPRVRFSESFRQEMLMRQERTGSSTLTETQSASDGKLTIDLELPLDGFDTAALDASTPFSIKAGGFEFSSTLGSDPEYRSGKTGATLIQSVTSASGNSRTTLVTARMNWNREKLTVKVEAKTPRGGKPVAAEDFLRGSPGKIEARTAAHVQWGELKRDVDVPFRGQVNRKVVHQGDLRGEVVTVDLRGEVKGR